MSEGSQDLTRKSSDCKIYVVLNRNIEMKITTDRLCLIDDSRNSSCQADTNLLERILGLHLNHIYKIPCYLPVFVSYLKNIEF